MTPEARRRKHKAIRRPPAEVTPGVIELLQITITIEIVDGNLSGPKDSAPIVQGQRVDHMKTWFD